MKSNSKKLKLKRKKARSKREAKRPHQVSSDEQESSTRVKKRRRLRKKRRLIQTKVSSNDDAPKAKIRKVKPVEVDEEIIDGFSIRSFSSLENLKSSNGSQSNPCATTPTVSITRKSSRIINSSNESNNDTQHTKQSSSRDSSASRSSAGDGYLGESEVSEGPDDRNSSDSEFFKAKPKHTVFPKAKIPAFPPCLPGIKHLQKYPKRSEPVPPPPSLLSTKHKIVPPTRGAVPHDPGHPPPVPKMRPPPPTAAKAYVTPIRQEPLSKPPHARSDSLDRGRVKYSPNRSHSRVNASTTPTNSANQKLRSPPSKSVQLFNPFSSNDLRDELNRRFLASAKNSESPGAPTVRAEIHQHQHTHQHMHQHTITAQPYPEQPQYPSTPSYPSRQTIPPQYQQTPPFRPTHPLPNPYHGLFSPSLYGQTAASHYAGLVSPDPLMGLPTPAGYQGIGIPSYNPLAPFGSHSHGAFQPRQLAPPPLVKTQPSTSLFRRPSSSKPGRWCAMHGVIANLIRQHQMKLGSGPTSRTEPGSRGSSVGQRTAFQAHPQGVSKDLGKQAAFGGLGQSSRSEHWERHKPLPASSKERSREVPHERPCSSNRNRSRSPTVSHSRSDRTHSRSPLHRQTPSTRIYPSPHIPPHAALLPTGHPVTGLPGHSKLPAHPPTPHIGGHQLSSFLADPLHSQQARMTELSRPPDFLLHGLAATPSYPRTPVMFPTDPLAALYSQPSLYRSGLYTPTTPLYPGLPSHVALHNPYRPPNQ